MIILMILTLIAGAVLIIAHVFIYLGVLLTVRQSKGNRNSLTLKASLIIPVRNEEQNLPSLLASIENQLDQLHELIFINDRSEDKSAAILDAFQKAHPQKMQVIMIKEPPGDGNPKLRALIQGVAKASGEILLFTDADCVLPPSWVEATVNLFADPQVGLVIGPIGTHLQGNLLSGYHNFDHLFKYLYTAASAGLGMANGGFGNNMAIRKSTLEEIGGLTTVQYSVTEDAAIICAVRGKTGNKIRATLKRDTLVTTTPMGTWRDLINQELRWHMGGLFSPDLPTRLSYTWVMSHLTLSTLLAPLGLVHPLFFLFPLSTYCCLLISSLIAARLTAQSSLTYWLSLPFLVLVTMGINSYLTVLALFRRKVQWKGQRISKR